MLSFNQELRIKCDRFAPYYNRSEYLGEILGIRKLRKNLIRSASGRVLELGIGTGKNLPYYQDSCELVGIDFSSEMLKITNRRAPINNGIFRFFFIAIIHPLFLSSLFIK